MAGGIASGYQSTLSALENALFICIHGRAFGDTAQDRVPAREFADIGEFFDPPMKTLLVGHALARRLGMKAWPSTSTIT